MLGKVLFFGRKKDKNVIKLITHLKKKSKTVNVIYSSKPKESFKKNKFLSQDYDYIFCFRSLHILNQKLINKAKLAAINFHPSIPKYRGMGCINFAMYNNEKIYGSTAHLIDSKIDHGKIINVKRFKLLKRYSVETLLAKTHQSMLKQAIQLINLLSANKKNLNKLIARSKKESWSKKIKNRKDLDNFYSINHKISKKEIVRKIRASYIHNSFRPYSMIGKYKFVLLEPYPEQDTNEQKYKMYYNLPKDLKKK